MHKKTRWLLAAASVLLFVVALLVWRQVAPSIVAASLEKAIIAQLSEPVPMGVGRPLGRWHWDKAEKIPWGVRLINLELRPESGGPKLIGGAEVTVRQESKGLVVAVSRWEGGMPHMFSLRGAYAETTVRGTGVLQDIRLYDVRMNISGNASSGLQIAPEVFAERIAIGAYDRANGASGVKATGILLEGATLAKDTPKFMLAALEIDRIGSDGFPRRLAMSRLQMRSVDLATSREEVRNLVDMMSLVANPAPDPISSLEITVADIHSGGAAEGLGKGVAELRVEMKAPGHLALNLSAYRAQSGIRGAFEMSFMGSRSRNFAELAQEMKTASALPEMSLALLELNDPGSSMRSATEWQQLRAFVPALQKSGVISRADARKIDAWFSVPPGDNAVFDSLRLAGDMRGGRLTWRVTN